MRAASSLRRSPGAQRAPGTVEGRLAAGALRLVLETSRALLAGGLAIVLAACSPKPAPPPSEDAARARNLVVITIDTMRPDHVGAYGYAPARTPVIDRLAREGTRFDRAYAAAPITLTSHATLFTGLYPPGHGARHNGVPVRTEVRTIAESLRQQGFATGAFVAAFPLDKRFGLARGFDVYDDRMPRASDGRLANERPADAVVDRTLAWLKELGSPGARPPTRRFFLWVHLFEPHAPYGDPVGGRAVPALQRYDGEIAVADRAVGRILAAIEPIAAQTLVVLASDHGEAFGEHGEVGHSLFVYDTTLRVALILRGPSLAAGRVVSDHVGLVDLTPTLTRLLGTSPMDGDGIDLRPALAGRPLEARRLYAETFAPLLDFGWSSLRALRDGRWKAIAAPRPEMYDLETDPGESADLSAGPRTWPPDITARIDAISGPELPPTPRPSGQAADRLGSLGYVQGGRANPGRARPDPKDRRALAARISAVTSGELQGDAALTALAAIVAEDPRNGQMQLRLGDELLRRDRPPEAALHFQAALDAGVPSADPFLGLATCQARSGRLADALRTLERSRQVEADNPVVLVNLGLLHAQAGRAGAAIDALRSALALDPDLHEARFDLARLLAREGRRADALAEAQTLLQRLPPNTPQRSEVERLVAALQ
jgi:choline-sulfatase